MMNMINKIGLMVVLLLGTIVYCKIDERNAFAQEMQAAGTYGEFEGFVTNYDNGHPLYMTKIKFFDADSGVLKKTTYTDSRGYYYMYIWNGTYRIEASKVGFITKSKTAYACCPIYEDPTRVDFRLKKVAQ